MLNVLFQTSDLPATPAWPRRSAARQAEQSELESAPLWAREALRASEVLAR